jgi:hypothetical protein
MPRLHLELWTDLLLAQGLTSGSIWGHNVRRSEASQLGTADGYGQTRRAGRVCGYGVSEHGQAILTTDSRRSLGAVQLDRFYVEELEQGLSAVAPYLRG